MMNSIDDAGHDTMEQFQQLESKHGHVLIAHKDPIFSYLRLLQYVNSTVEEIDVDGIHITE